VIRPSTILRRHPRGRIGKRTGDKSLRGELKGLPVQGESHGAVVALRGRQIEESSGARAARRGSRR